MILNRKKLKMAKWSGEPQWKHTVYQFSLAQTATMTNLFYNIFFSVVLSQWESCHTSKMEPFRKIVTSFSWIC